MPNGPSPLEFILEVGPAVIAQDASNHTASWALSTIASVGRIGGIRRRPVPANLTPSAPRWLCRPDPRCHWSIPVLETVRSSARPHRWPLIQSSLRHMLCAAIYAVTGGCRPA